MDDIRDGLSGTSTMALVLFNVVKYKRYYIINMSFFKYKGGYIFIPADPCNSGSTRIAAVSSPYFSNFSMQLEK